jgi:questin oxidase-like protein
MKNSQVSYEVLDDALEAIASAGPELENGQSNHAPMAMEALCAMGRGDAVYPWLDHYRKQMTAWPMRRERISRETADAALGRLDRVADWRAFFENELHDAPWSDVVRQWAARLMPGFCAAAMHGVLRTGHAARALTLRETQPRLLELAAGLAYWAATYQVLPTDLSANAMRLSPWEAVLRVPLVPPDKRRFAGSITSSLEALDEFPPFAPVIATVDWSGELRDAVSRLTETFALVYLANARDVLTTIVFIHGVTSTAIVRQILPHLDRDAGSLLMRYAWQSGCALYSTFGVQPPTAVELESPSDSYEALVDTAISTGDEHAIKFTSACMLEDSLRPSPAYRSAVRHAVRMLRS